jgi:hypothetical protein
VNIDLHRYPRLRCRSSGNQIELWAAAKALSVYDAAGELCEKTNLPVPWITRW